MNKYPLLSKVMVIGLLMLLLSIPLLMVRGAIEERSMNREAATQDVARAHAGEQTLTGPVLYVPYTETFLRKVVLDGGQTREELVTQSHVAIRFPSVMETRSRLQTETRWRGVFPVKVFTSVNESTGQFVWSDVEPKEKNSQITLGQPSLLLGVSDLRGLLNAPQLKVEGRAIAVAPARAAQRLPLPLVAPLNLAQLRAGAVLPFSLQLELAGTGRIGWVPLADENRVHLQSSWPHPSFGGDFLPRTRSVSAQGFEASWSVPSLSTQAQRQFAQTGERPETPESFSVSLDDPVDVYRLTDRATKYGAMFILLTFAAFFVLEMVKRWRIHPMQYLMIGAALVLFFLLLLSIAEHLGFLPAYLSASAACIGLLAHYLRHVLGGWKPGLLMSGLLVALYGVLYGILMSEDNALMMGSLLLFGVLASIMVATRKVDWYSVMK
ncbi:cell envelope integrity protein CreD [Hydrogenophaga sp. BPS33]|uniref:cell envelope integrity protein CreD n=1 Tax=Hydrogenophaga sp. BPS33 TaxID=2651974 RepID=UPI00131FB06D|nr:cell envelope integrity protein CreD [Hydrogenophaga sp. BPS33]QHE87084.1 cell envelope integrity protein CreD [Hydrogenophaga sp. BPS33]